MSRYLALDLGAESGRAIAGTLVGGLLTMEELHRFPNLMVRQGEGLYWDVLGLWSEIRRSIEIAASERKLDLNGIGVDTWGVDWALIGKDGQLVERPRHYRDPRNAEAMRRVLEIVPREHIFGDTGIQFMQFNTLFQVY